MRRRYRFCLTLLIAGAISGCMHSGAYTHNMHSRASWESYDQANLKRNDAGCPTAVWIAPAGELEQCP